MKTIEIDQIVNLSMESLPTILTYVVCSKITHINSITERGQSLVQINLVGPTYVIAKESADSFNRRLSAIALDSPE